MSLFRTAIQVMQELHDQPVHLRRRFLFGPVPNAWQQDLLPKIGNALFQIVNSGPGELDHAIVGSADIQGGLEQFAPDEEARLLPEDVLPAIPVQAATKAGA